MDSARLAVKNTRVDYKLLWNGPDLDTHAAYMGDRARAVLRGTLAEDAPFTYNMVQRADGRRQANLTDNLLPCLTTAGRWFLHAPGSSRDWQLHGLEALQVDVYNAYM